MKCEYCGAEFTQINKEQRFCSRRCNGRARQETLSLVLSDTKCPICNKNLTEKQVRQGNEYCSRECQGIARKKESEERRRRVCKVCGKSFIANYPNGAALKGKSRCGLFCSNECRGKWQSTKANGCVAPTDPFKKKYGFKRGESCVLYINRCVTCGLIFAYKRKHKYCSKACAVQYHQQQRTPHRKKPRICKQCGATFTPEYGNKKRDFCSKKCAKQYLRKISGSGDARKRARKYGVDYEFVNVKKVFERDNWHCQICGKYTPEKNRGKRYPNSPEIDHRVPISKGGGHLYSNVQCVCRQCNRDKSNKNEWGYLPLFDIKASV